MLTEAARTYLKQMFPDEKYPLASDPELFEMFSNFAFDEILALEDRTRFIAILAALVGSQSVDLFTEMLLPALRFGVSPVEIKEILYQGTVYLGMGRVYPFLGAVDRVFSENGITVDGQATVSPVERLEEGIKKQVEIFGDEKRDFYKTGSPLRQKIAYHVSENAYGEYYTRGGLDTKTRTLVTFCFLAAQGGCETQLRTHIKGNLHVGNDAEFLVDVLLQILPYIGYPRTLNALTCIEEIIN